MKKEIFVWIVGLGCSLASPCYANWTLNLGYHNPSHSSLGINFLYWGSQWNFELGLGWLEARSSDNKDSQNEKDSQLTVNAAGEIDVKYRFTTGGFAPFVQLGAGAASGATVGDTSGASANVGAFFAGLGVMLGKPGFHGYLAYNLFQSRDSQVQAGIGFDI